MTLNVHVGSKTQPAVFVTIPWQARTTIDAQREAIQFVRAKYRIVDPIPLSEHEAAVRMRLQFLEQFAPKMDVQVLNGHSPMCFDNRYEPCEFD